MSTKGTLVRYTAEALRGLKSESDWARVDAMAEEELESALASDPDWQDIPKDWYKDAKPGLPSPFPRENNRQVTLRRDPEVLEHLKRGGQSRINAMLRTSVEADARRQAG